MTELFNKLMNYSESLENMENIQEKKQNKTMSNTYLQSRLLPEQWDRPPDLYEGRHRVI